MPSLSMATSAMDPNRGAAAPYESNVGGRRQGSRLLWLIPLFGAPKWHPSKNWEMGGAPGLGGRHSTMIHNNQPNDGVGSVCVCSWLPVPGGSRNYAIPIATSSPRESPPHMCYPVVLALRSPWGASSSQAPHASRAKGSTPTPLTYATRDSSYFSVAFG